MGIQTAIHLADAEPVSWDGLERRGRRSDERFPWEQSSQRERLQGRIVASTAGLVLAALVVLANAGPINQLQSEARHLAGVFQTAPARAATPVAAPARRAPAPVITTATAGRVADPLPPRVQFGSYASEAAAVAGLAKIKGRYEDVITGRELHISDALVGEDRLYRVSVHLASEDEAEDLCATIKKNSGDCMVWPGTP